MFTFTILFILYLHQGIADIHAEGNKIIIDEDAFSKLLDRLTVLEANDKTLRERVDILENKDREQENIIEKLTVTLNNADQEINELKDELKDTAKEIIGLKERVHRLTYRYSGQQDRNNATSKRTRSRIRYRQFASSGTFTKLYGDVSGGRNIRQVEVDATTAFFAVVAKDQLEHLGANQNVIFEHVITNLGNAYNPHHGVFIAPRSGLYLFSVSILSGHNREVHAQYAVNGRGISNINARGTDGRHGEGSQTIILQLNKGDDVSIHNMLADDAIWGGFYTSFSGILLQEMDTQTPAVVGK